MNLVQLKSEVIDCKARMLSAELSYEHYKHNYVMLGMEYWLLEMKAANDKLKAARENLRKARQAVAITESVVLR